MEETKLENLLYVYRSYEHGDFTMKLRAKSFKDWDLHPNDSFKLYYQDTLVYSNDINFQYLLWPDKYKKDSIKEKILDMTGKKKLEKGWWKDFKKFMDFLTTEVFNDDNK